MYWLLYLLRALRLCRGQCLLGIGLWGGIFSLGWAQPVADSAQPSARVWVFSPTVVAAEQALLRSFRYHTRLPDSLGVVRELQQLLLAAHGASYLLATADSLTWQGDTLWAHLSLGNRYRWAYLHPGNVPEDMLIRSGFREKFFREKPFRYAQWHRLETSLLRYAEDNGYPFARLQLDSLALHDQQLAGILHYEPGPHITLDSVRLEGDLSVSPRFMSRYLRLLPGEAFSQQRLDAAVWRLRQTPYLKVQQAPTVTFADHRARIDFVLDKQRVNQIDGVLGLLPNERGGGRPLLTGEFNLELHNLFASGKYLKAHWQRLKEESQALQLAYVHPVLLGSPLDVGGTFQSLKEDSTFLNLEGQLTVAYQMQRGGRLSALLRNQRSRVLADQGNRFGADVSNFDFVSYGLAYDWHNLDDVFYPHRGWRLHTGGQAGNKRLRPGARTAEGAVADTVPTRSLQFDWQGSVAHYLPLSPRLVLLTRAVGAALFNEYLFFNDLYRVGGLRTLRGFNENNFFASRYGVATAELRWFIEADSYLLLFCDQAYVAYSTVSQSFEDFPLGVGTGISFRTGAGIFNFVYSMGRSRDQLLAVSQSKIHFGLSSRF